MGAKRRPLQVPRAFVFLSVQHYFWGGVRKEDGTTPDLSPLTSLPDFVPRRFQDKTFHVIVELHTSGIVVCVEFPISEGVIEDKLREIGGRTDASTKQAKMGKLPVQQ